MVKPVILFLFLCISICATSQKLMQLTFHQTGKHKVFIYQGERIKCRFKDGSHAAGIISNITDSTFDLADKTYLIDSLKAIAKRKGRAGTVIAFIIVGSPILLTIINPDPTVFKPALREFPLPFIESSFILGLYMHSKMRRIKKWNISIINFEELHPQKPLLALPYNGSK